MAGGILAVQCQIAQRVVRVDENIRRQTGAIRHLFLSEHGGLAVLHTAGLHALNRSCPLTGRRLTGRQHGAVVILIQACHALAGGVARNQQQILCAIAGQIGQLHSGIFGFKNDIRRAVFVKIAHGKRTCSVSRQAPGEDHAALAARLKYRKFDRTQCRSAAVDRAGADVAVILLAVNSYRKFVARRRGGAAEKRDGLLYAVVVQIGKLNRRTVFALARRGVGYALCQLLFQLSLQALVIARWFGRGQQLIARRKHTAAQQQKEQQRR